eukprot:TRINITY_DN15042_c0_g1_i1.p1 TRINITY_DN15042_c0_g1~~TRINITY_DN15042_c0_g1_i1.p1  ORF type:complete len:652 (+),score=106.04 TRINITY_DN15042_c0_g1_i1:149-2104(+)
MAARFGVLLPVTSRGSNVDVIEQRLRRVADLVQCEDLTTVVILGIDRDDRELNNARSLERLQAAFRCKVVVEILAHPAGHVCLMWRSLAKASSSSGCEYHVLLGDDIRIKCERNWMKEVVAKFGEIHLRNKQIPRGFGIVCLNDLSHPGFPTFPVIHNTHLQIFDDVFPQLFINQDADPFLYAVYQRWNATAFADAVQLTNEIGGDGEARYTKLHVDWKNDVLAEAVAKVDTWLQKQTSREVPRVREADVRSSVPLHGLHRFITMDVIVPTYRCDMAVLSSICALTVPPGVVTRFIIVMDNPAHDYDKLYEQLLPAVHGQRHLLYLRKNQVNLGAPATRNRALDESTADWIVFLDDDIIPSQNVLVEYAATIAANGHSDKVKGFVGVTTFPASKSQVHNAVRLSGINYFYGIALNSSRPAWGVTANVCTRRSAVRFDTDFPRTGGGEDIDYCIRAGGHPTFVATPHAHVEHPWWNDGKRCWHHFWSWSLGDGQLVDKHPTLAYRAMPNVLELLTALLLFLCCAVVHTLACGGSLVSLQHLVYTVTVLSLAMSVTDITLDVLWWTVKDRGHCSDIVGLPRVTAAVEACLIKNMMELGHMLCHLRRGKVLNVTKRFDWWGGADPRAIVREKRRGLLYFVVHVGVCVVLLRDVL